MRLRRLAVVPAMLVLVLCVVFVPCQANSVAPAEQASAIEAVVRKVEKADAKIEKAIEQAQKQADNADPDDADYIDKVIEKLLEKTNKIVEKTTEFADERGVELEFEDKTVKVGGREVEVDPMKVAGY